MRGVFAVMVASLAVLCVLYVLVSEDRNRPSGSGLTQREKTSDAGDRLVEALMLRCQRQLDYSNTSAGSTPMHVSAPRSLMPTSAIMKWW
jgi:hypothetical protein